VVLPVVFSLSIAFHSLMDVPFAALVTRCCLQVFAFCVAAIFQYCCEVETQRKFLEHAIMTVMQLEQPTATVEQALFDMMSNIAGLQQTGGIVDPLSTEVFDLLSLLKTPSRASCRGSLDRLTKVVEWMDSDACPKVCLQ
jgi:hypothetical protein